MISTEIGSWTPAGVTASSSKVRDRVKIVLWILGGVLALAALGTLFGPGWGDGPSGGLAAAGAIARVLDAILLTFASAAFFLMAHRRATTASRAEGSPSAAAVSDDPDPLAARDVSASAGRPNQPWIVAVALALGAVVMVTATLASARSWTKVDIPEQLETFHAEEYLTGRYDITDDGVSPCWVNQDWVDCINLMVNEYNRACAGVDLTPLASSRCDAYGTSIDGMRSDGGYGYIVTSLGGYGHLTRIPEMATRQVGNNDDRPAVTHEAVCYLGFLGECA